MNQRRDVVKVMAVSDGKAWVVAKSGGGSRTCTGRVLRVRLDDVVSEPESCCRLSNIVPFPACYAAKQLIESTRVHC